ncbi:set1/Ash2 histone methyltransferase complex subunit ASH2 isoform X3 [Parasteatoda tepidariorum]|uniref:set1/Ash2 histone methyltransferase complex subunit ASH2 isoform X3 n=1 Tax=Parasteatoda tepidariorum TaxID=114398 RepID=UPI001C71B671|nr:set1/Ash2 histone methyltransferase complex subunit ASH2 isoform X3 [Parasteatoda tepidariorum]
MHLMKKIEINDSSGDSKVDSTMTDPSAEVVEKMDVDENVEGEINKENIINNQPTVEVPTPVEISETLPRQEESDKNITISNEVRPEDFQVMQNNPTKENNVEIERNGKKEFSHTNGNEESQCSIDERSQESHNCYCGRERNLGIVELQCGGCSKWFHENCVSVPIGKCVPFMSNYSFLCKLCNSSGIESFSKKQTTFSQMCGTALANLMQQSKADGKERSMFSKDREVIPYIVSNWESLTPMARRIKQTWHNTLHKAVLKDSEIFLCDERGHDGSMYGLVHQDLGKIGPSYDAVSRGPQKLNIDSSSSQGTFGVPKGRSSKRKFFDGQMTGAGKKVKSDLVMPKLPPNGYPLEHPFNKDGYRYILAEPDPHAPFRQEFDEGQDWAGKPIPGWLYRKLTPSNVLIALHDRAPQLKVSEDRLSVTGEKGYCMARATHGVNRGTWYFECTIEDMPEGSATRLGWSQALANLQGPLGYDKFSYSWRSRKGTKFHESKGYHYADVGYGQGDTLGFLIHLPKTSETIPLPQIYKDKPLVKFKSYLYYEEKDEMQLELKNMKPLPKSKIVFYKNGKSFGTAFENINAGTYYPAISLYKSCTVSLNFGPSFKHSPEENFKPICNLAHDATIEQAMTDLLFFTENKGKLRLDNL